jgi:hypothetical protein
MPTQKPKPAQKKTTAKRNASATVGRAKVAKPAAAARPKDPAPAALAPKMSDAAVEEKTGKRWAEWFALLNAAGCRALNHREIVAVLDRDFEIGPWWQQMVAVTYEQAMGLRKKHETGGLFEVSGSKTVGVPIGELYRAWVDPQIRRRWLDDPEVVVRKANQPKSLRLGWVDGKTLIGVNFWDKGPAKSQVSLNHGKLASAAAAEKQKKYWGAQLEKLRDILEGGG